MKRPEADDGQAVDLDDLQVSDSLQVAPLDGMSADDARMLAALDRISSDGDQMQLGVAATPPPEHPPASPSPRLRGEGQGGGAAADPFAPPPDDREELRLDVGGDLALADRLSARPSAPRLSADTLTPARRPSTSHPVARPGAGLGTFIKLVLLVAVLGTGGFALHRYLTRGYLLSPPAPEPLRVTIQVTPPQAELSVDGAVLAEPGFTLEPGASRRVRAQLRDRLTVEELVTATGDPLPPLVLRLPHRLHAIVPGALAPSADAGGPESRSGDEVIDAALAKLSRYRQCVEPLAAAIAGGRERYLAKSGGNARTLRADAPPEVAGIPVQVSGDCRMAIDSARTDQPALAGIDDAAARLMPAVDELAALAGEVGAYYQSGKHRVDHLRWGRRQHAALVAAYDKAWAAHQALATAVAARSAWWERRELEALGGQGKHLHWHLRRLALAAQAWLWAELAGAPAADARARLQELTAVHREARGYAGGHAAETAEVAGARQFFAAATDMVEAAGSGGRASAERALPLYNRSIELFNAMVL